METFSALLALSAGNSPVPVNSPHKGQWRGALMFSLICAWINDWVNNHEAGDLRHRRGHYDVIVMLASWREDLGSRSMCLGHVQVITSHSKLLDVIDLPCPDACFWHHSLPSGMSKSSLTWWRHQKETFPRYCPFVRGIHRSPVNSPHKGQWLEALFSLICAWANGWVNNIYAGDSRRHHAHYDVTVMESESQQPASNSMIYTHWGRHKMAAILQAIFSKAYAWMKMIEFRFKFHWNLFPGVQLTISQHWFK